MVPRRSVEARGRCRNGNEFGRLAGKGDSYYERYYTPSGLRRLFQHYDVWDYTLPVLADPGAFSADDNVPAWAARIPEPALAAALPLAWHCFRSRLRRVAYTSDMTRA